MGIARRLLIERDTDGVFEKILFGIDKTSLHFVIARLQHQAFEVFIGVVKGQRHLILHTDLLVVA